MFDSFYAQKQSALITTELKKMRIFYVHGLFKVLGSPLNLVQKIKKLFSRQIETLKEVVT